MGTIDNRPMEIGQECNFKGVKDYIRKHLLGVFQGHNVIYIVRNEKGD